MSEMQSMQNMEIITVSKKLILEDAIPAKYSKSIVYFLVISLVVFSLLVQPANSSQYAHIKLSNYYTNIDNKSKKHSILISLIQYSYSRHQVRRKTSTYKIYELNPVNGTKHSIIHNPFNQLMPLYNKNNQSVLFLNYHLDNNLFNVIQLCYFNLITQSNVSLKLSMLNDKPSKLLPKIDNSVLEYSWSPDGKYTAILEGGEELIKKGPFKIYLSSEYDWWTVFSVVFPGFE